MSHNIYDCDMYMVESEQDLANFSCGSKDLDEFFALDAFSYDRQMLGKTYYFETKDTSQVIAAFTVANDSIKASLISKSTRNRLNRKIPNTKRTRSYPAVLIGRLGVSGNEKGTGVGSQVIDFIKKWFSQHNNKSGCRYVVVDAYNLPQVLQFYEKNEFQFLYDNEQEEKDTFGLKRDEKLNSRMMYFDLINYSDIN